MKKTRSPAQIAAEKAFRERTEQVLVRFSKEEATRLDVALKAGESRASWIKARVMAALKRRK